jgi:hypothetical protein
MRKSSDFFLLSPRGGEERESEPLMLLSPYRGRGWERG